MSNFVLLFLVGTKLNINFCSSYVSWHRNDFEELTEKSGPSFETTQSADGSIVVVSNGSGLVRVYERDLEGNLSQLGTDLTGGSSSDFGPHLSISDDGNRLAVGSPAYAVSGVGNQAGRVQIYDFDGSDWIEKHAFYGDQYQGFFGTVSLSGDGEWLAIGSTWKEGPGSIDRAGMVKVFSMTDGTQKGNTTLIK